MRPGREIDARIAQEVFGFEVWAKNKVLHEKAPTGDRPLKMYSRDIEWAWSVAEKMRVSILPIEGGHWFAFCGKLEGWKSPKDFLEYLDSGSFTDCGAAVEESAALAICKAALVVVEKRRKIADAQTASETLKAELSAPLH